MSERTDKERLDWLQQAKRPVHPPLEVDAVSPQHRHPDDDNWTVVPIAPDQTWHSAPTLRLSIDAAMRAALRDGR